MNRLFHFAISIVLLACIGTATGRAEDQGQFQLKGLKLGMPKSAVETMFPRMNFQTYGRESNSQFIVSSYLGTIRQGTRRDREEISVLLSRETQEPRVLQVTLSRRIAQNISYDELMQKLRQEFGPPAEERTVRGRNKFHKEVWWGAAPPPSVPEGHARPSPRAVYLHLTFYDPFRLIGESTYETSFHLTLVDPIALRHNRAAFAEELERIRTEGRSKILDSLSVR